MYTFSALLQYLYEVALGIKDGKDEVGFREKITSYWGRMTSYGAEIEIAANLKPGALTYK